MHTFHKILPLLLLLCLATGHKALAQAEKGDFNIGGGFGFSSKDFDGERSVRGQDEPDLFEGSQTALTGDLRFGYFFVDGLVGGLTFGYENFSRDSTELGETSDQNQTTELEQNLLSFGPYVRYYYMFNDKVGLFAHGDAGFGFGDQTSTSTFGGNSSSSTSDIDFFTATGGIGFVAFFNKSVSFEILVDYRYRELTTTPEGVNPTETTTLRQNMGLNMGINFFIPGGDRTGAGSLQAPDK